MPRAAARAAALARCHSRFGWVLALCLAWIIPLQQAHAQCDARLQCCATPPPGGDPSCDGGGPAEQPSPGPSVGAGNPLDIISGNKHQREVDLPRLPGVLGLEVVRHYNSAASHRGSGNLGRGWRLSYQAELHAGRNGLRIVQADGATLEFARGIVEPDRYRGTEPERGVVQRFEKPEGTHYVWTWPGGRELRFEHGRLVQVREPTGEFVSMQHGRNGDLMQVTDPQGRTLNLHHDRNGRIEAIDTPVGRISYAYGGRRGNLIGVMLPGEGGVSRTYHYEDARHPHAMTGISVAGTGQDGATATHRLVTWGYDERGHAISSVRGDG